MPAGRKRKPDALKAIQGTARRDRSSKGAPKPSTAKPHPPAWLAGRAKSIFRLLVKRLDELGMASSSYTEMLALLASRLEEVERFSKHLAKKGTSYETKTQAGALIVRQRPEVVLLNEAKRHAQSLLAEFGLSPAQIAKVVSAPQQETNPFKVLAGGKK